MKTILSSAVCLIFVGCANTSHYPGQVYFPTPDNNNIGVASGVGYYTSSNSYSVPQVNTIITSRGTYQIIPNYTTGRTMAIIQTSKGK
jgi:hypothetical protein